MQNYKFSVTDTRLNETLNYYFQAESDDDAKKYFILDMHQRINIEMHALNFDKIAITADKLNIVASCGEEDIIIGTLQCIPNKFKKLTLPPSAEYTSEQLVRSLIKKGFFNKTTTKETKV